MHNDGLSYRVKPFARSTVYKILKNEKHSGIYHYNDELFTNIYPRIVPEKIFNIVRDSVEDNKYGKRDSDAVYIYYNYIDKKSPDEFEHQAFLFYEENVDLFIKDDYKLKELDYILNMLVQMYI